LFSSVPSRSNASARYFIFKQHPTPAAGRWNAGSPATRYALRMKALRFYEPGRVAVVAAADPKPAAGEVVLRVDAAGLCNSDVRVFLGEKHAVSGVIPGHEMAGKVVALGKGARASLGDTVAVCPILCCGVCSFCRDGFRNRCPQRKTLGYDLDGGIAEFVRIPAEMVAMGHLLPMDPAAPPELRAFVEPLACVLNSLESLGVHPGSPLGIVGGGPMGLVHLIAGLAYGAGPILVVEPEAERRKAAMDLGASAAVAPPEAAEAARELTAGEGFPAVAVAVGLAAAMPTALALVRRLGWINMFAGFPPDSKFTLDLNRIHYDEIRVFGTQNAPFPLFGLAARMMPRLAAIGRVITNRYDLAHAAEAYAARLGRAGLKSAVIM
jgi:L-iditol 2-dehydrogenase